MTKSDVTLTTRLVRRADLPQAALSPLEVVVMNAERDHYFGLAETGKRIWEHLSEPREVDEICELLSDEFDVNPRQCERETLEFLGALYNGGLVVDVNKTGEGA